MSHELLPMTRNRVGRTEEGRASGSIQFLKISFSASAGSALVEEPEEIQVALVR
jgi:hypothetical protein